MLAFLGIVGHHVAHGDSRVAFRALRSIPLPDRTAWRIVERWQALQDIEALTGWTAETAAAGAVMRAAPAWASTPWIAITLHWFGPQRDDDLDDAGE